MTDEISPKDRFITVYGRNPVHEVLLDDDLHVDKVVIADGAHGSGLREIRQAARRRGVAVQQASAERVKKLAGNGRQDQGVFADVVAPRMRPLEAALAAPLATPLAAPLAADGAARLRTVLVLDGVTTPANVGMILRSATAAGVDGIVVPRRGVASIDPLVVKASAGVAFRAPILKAFTAAEAVAALKAAGFHVVGLDAGGDDDLFSAHLPEPVAFVLGSETAGLSPDVAALVDTWVSIPMAAGVESLNVSAAAAVVCFELVRRSRL